MVGPDREPHPGLTEIKKAYQYVWFQPVDLRKGIIRVENRYDFTNLNQYTIEYTIQANTETVQSGILPTQHLAPGTNKQLTIPLRNVKNKPGTEYFLNLYVKSKQANLSVPAGSVSYTHLHSYCRSNIKVIRLSIEFI